MANRFLNNIKINDSYTLPAADGTADQVITTDGSGQLSFVDQSTLAVDSAEVVEVPVKNLQGSALTKGDPVYISGSVGASGRLEVQLADAGNTAKMPAVGLLKQDLAINGEGYVVVTGKLRNLVTSPIDGVTPSEGDVVYVKSGGSTGAALTTTKPTGSSNLIQNMGKVGRVSTSSDGTFVVSSILRSNDVPNLSTGKIWVGDGNTTESTVVHLDEINNEMGINTNNPAAVLHVTRSTGSVPLFQVDDVGDKYFQVLPDSNTTFLIGDLDALGGNGYIKGTFSSIQFHSESGELVRIKDNGNVGIGTTNPQKNLVVSDSSVPTIRIDNTKNGTWTAGEDFGGLEWYGNDASGEGPGIKGYIKLDSDNIYGAGFDMRFGTTDGTNGITERMVIAKSGNVGIGTTSPGTFLHIDSNSTNNIPLKVESGTTSSYMQFMDTGTTADYKVRVGSINDDLALWAGGSERARVKSNGNVGIGTTDPDGKLHVDGGGASTYNIFSRSDTKWIYIHSGGTDPAIGWDNAGELRFGTSTSNVGGGFSEKMRIDVNGNVGIGTTNPNFKTHLYNSGNAVLGITAGVAFYATLQFGSTSDATRGAIEYYTGDDSLRLKTGNNVERMRITSAGNVGIGTTDPKVKVHASDGGTIPSLDAGTMFLASNTSGTGDYSSMSIMSGTAGIASLFFGDTDAEKRGSVRYLNSTDEMRFRTANTDRVTIKGNGNVGIGTTDPGQKLDVDGYIAAHRFTDSDNASFYLEPGSGATGQWKVQTPSGYVLIGPNNTSWAHFYTDRSNGYYFDKRIVADTGIFASYDENLTLQAPYNTTRMTIKSSNGYVGINTTNPGYHLDVDGEARIGSVDRQSTRLLIQAENTAGSPAAATEIRMLGYESRAQGIFFQDSGNSGEEWFAGLNYAASWGKYSIGYDASGGEAEYTANAKLTVVGSTGNVGIGTASPSRMLHVSGDSSVAIATLQRTNANTTGGFGALQWTASDDHSVASISVVGDGNNEGGHMDFRTTSAAANNDPYSNTNLPVRMRINSSGKVGIGTTSPRGTLDINGTLSVIGGTFTSGASGADSNASAGIVLRRGKKLFSGIPSGGNEDFYLRSLLEQTTSGSIIIGQGGTSLISDIALKPGSSGNITFFGSGSEDMRIDSSGDVGIGTTDPASKLEVDGGDIEIDDSDRGLILRAPNGTRYRLQVANDGSLSTTAL